MVAFRCLGPGLATVAAAGVADGKIVDDDDRDDDKDGIADGVAFAAAVTDRKVRKSSDSM